jgi:4-hydroxythreonine-4-phosphate dehydrogenase
VVTQGDPAGIGIEIALKAWLRREELSLAPFALVADEAVVAAACRHLRLDVPLEPGDEAASSFIRALPVIPIAGPGRYDPGRPDPGSAGSTTGAIDEAVRRVRAGLARAVITNPIAKSVLYEAGFRFPGHTEYLAALAAPPGEPSPRPVMMLWSETLAVVPVTIHIPLRDVPGALTKALVIETGMIVAEAMHRYFSVPHPRLALAGLNPHAGESGTIGREDIEIVEPAIAELRGLGLDVTGPLPADTMFHARARANYDVALCMYHDQALIPIKTLAFDDGVNVTLGLPFLRTSPDHGTAFDIAGKGLARPDSLVAALRLADRLTRREAQA